MKLTSTSLPRRLNPLFMRKIVCSSDKVSVDRLSMLILLESSEIGELCCAPLLFLLDFFFSELQLKDSEGPIFES
uniref:Ovule protein n=1 Tax=Schistosoma curassoni TaxID=6186 RepID=A0A183KFN9_9TREM